MKTYTYRPTGVCSREMEISYEGDTIVDVKILGGCNGNLKGISNLVKGMKLQDVADRISGINCGIKKTSCPDQLAQACREILEKGE